jgi:hypothetical protein
MYIYIYIYAHINIKQFNKILKIKHVFIIFKYSILIIINHNIYI